WRDNQRGLAELRLRGRRHPRMVARGAKTAVAADIVMGRTSGVAGVALGLALAGCGVSNWIPSWDLKFPSAPPPASTVQVESEPAGAEAKSSIGPSCRTPCSLTVATSAPFTVTFTLAGYESQTVPVAPRPGGDPRASGEALK